MFYLLAILVISRIELTSTGKGSKRKGKLHTGYTTDILVEVGEDDGTRSNRRDPVGKITTFVKKKKKKNAPGPGDEAQ